MQAATARCFRLTAASRLSTTRLHADCGARLPTGRKKKKKNAICCASVTAIGRASRNVTWTYYAAESATTCDKRFAWVEFIHYFRSRS